MRKALLEIIEDIHDHEAVDRIEIFPFLTNQEASFFGSEPMRGEARVYVGTWFIGRVRYDDIYTLTNDLFELHHIEKFNKVNIH
jgi:hypothetical protein